MSINPRAPSCRSPSLPQLPFYVALKSTRADEISKSAVDIYPVNNDSPDNVTAVSILADRRRVFNGSHSLRASASFTRDIDIDRMGPDFSEPEILDIS